MFASLSQRFYAAEGGPGAPRSPLRGIWTVERMTVDGGERVPLLNDYDRQWQRVRTVALTKGRSRNWGALFSYDRPVRDRLILDGEMDGYRIRVELRLVEPDTFRLLNSQFRWVRPPG